LRSDDPSFIGWPLNVDFLDGRRWRVARDIGYKTAAGEVSTVRAGFVFDFASIPRLLWPLVPPAGDGHNLYGLAAVWHDWLYAHKEIGGRSITRKEADALFLEIMLHVRVSPWMARAMCRAVRVGGRLCWKASISSPKRIG
jgi:hypothetical protein